MKRYSRFIVIAALVSVTLSILLYVLHFVIFEDSHHIFIYLMGDLAFLPLEVFLVVIVIERILSERERRAQREKLNMVMGTFYSEVGNKLVKELYPAFPNKDEFFKHLNIEEDWTDSDFTKASEYAKSFENMPVCSEVKLAELRDFLVAKRPFLLTMLENPMLFEHDEFTDILFAAFHLGEELEFRDSFDKLPPCDLEHLSIDIKRFYNNLLSQWILYARHLKAKYPYLFSLVSRTHPFQENPSPIVAER